MGLAAAIFTTLLPVVATLATGQLLATVVLQNREVKLELLLLEIDRYASI